MQGLTYPVRLIAGKLGDTFKAKPANPLLKDRRHYHVSDELLQHYECALRTNMKAR